MFTGIIEAMGTIVDIRSIGTNLDFTVKSELASALKIDQSLSHNGVCLTVTEIGSDTYKVTAIKETLDRSNLGALKIGDSVNLERCLQMNGRLDGHIVQGHVDATATVTSIQDFDGSKKVFFEYSDPNHITVPKGSITVNGVSLTVVDSENIRFSVAVIPYTWEHTNFYALDVGSTVNLEFDIIGKYIAAYLNKQTSP